MIAVLVALIMSPRPATPSRRAVEALQMLSAGRAAEAAAALDTLSRRMPHNSRLAMDLAAALFADSAAAEADTVLSPLRAGEGYLDVPPDTLASARIAISLAAAMNAGDYAGVSAAADTLRALLGRRGDPASVDAGNLEAALRWLQNHEPPPPQDGGGGESDSPPEREEDGDSQSQQDGAEAEGQTDSRGETGERRSGEEVPEVPGRITPEMARRILDMVEDASPRDTLKSRATGGRLSW